MTVLKRKTSAGVSKFYSYRFKVGGKEFTGPCYASDGKTKCTTKKEAEAYEREIKKIKTDLAKQKTVKALVENFREELTGGTKIKIADAFDLSTKKPRKKQPAKRHLDAKRSYWNDFVSFIESEYPEVTGLADVQKKHAEEYIQFIRTKGRFDKTVKQEGKSDYKRKHNLSNKSCNTIQQTITEVFELLRSDAGLIENPFSSIPKLDNESESREPFSEEELKLISEKADDFVHPIFAIGVTTALREGDICTLKWSEIDLDTDIITRKMLKTRRTVQIPIMPPLRTYLLNLKSSTGTEEYVLPEHAGIYLSNHSGISYRVKQFLHSIGIVTTKKVEGRTREVSIKDVHSLRHTFAYLAGVHGIPFLIVKDICGHVNEKMTELYQKHADNKLKREKLINMPDFMGLAGDAPKRLSDSLPDYLELINEIDLLIRSKDSLSDVDRAILQKIEATFHNL